MKKHVAFATQFNKGLWLFLPRRLLGALYVKKLLFVRDKSLSPSRRLDGWKKSARKHPHLYGGCLGYCERGIVKDWLGLPEWFHHKTIKMCTRKC